MPFYNLAPESTKQVEYRDQSSIVGSAGGFTIPIEQLVRFWNEVLDDRLLELISTVILPYSSQPRFVIENLNNLAMWVGENAAIGSVDEAFIDGGPGQWHKLVAAAGASEEFMQDARVSLLGEPNEGEEVLAGSETILSVLQAKRIRRALNTAIMTGSGTGEPLGILSDARVPRTAGAISRANIELIYGNLTPRYVEDAVWLCAQTTWPSFRSASGDLLSIGMGDRIQVLERPVVLNEYVPTDTIIFGRLANYSMLVSNGSTMVTDRETGAERGQVKQYLFMRGDGQLVFGTGNDTPVAILVPINAAASATDLLLPAFTGEPPVALTP